ncbi:Helix-turn-helix domain-containing protein [Alkalispirochaeta americana]|uniref:Helix-turn-helix domain-containing protein n=1 Tax=Alkalispirochaeta americana TaxID=159291 RepID=A0A1N6NLX4_9SPIO|nr:helix-turn-helix domain-containing protein [Alkalispirochaeta americana]SIP93070.1 Helix-turn-helix domain-containing protein [Alkalispirochaeta americana]
MSWDWLNRKGFAEMMKSLSTHQLKQREIITYLALVSFVDADGYAYPGIDTIARTGGIGRATVVRALPELEKHQLIRIEHGQGRTVNRYLVVPPSRSRLNLNLQEKPLSAQSERLSAQSEPRSRLNLSLERFPENVTITPPDRGDDYIPFELLPEDS